MSNAIDPAFARLFMASATDFNAYGVHRLFNDWWATAPADAIEKYVAAIESHPEQGRHAAARWLADPVSIDRMTACAPGTLGAAWGAFMIDNDLVERLAQGYRDYHDELAATGMLDRLPPVLAHKVLRGYQTHDLHHVLTGLPPTPFGELALQAFQLAQTRFPYAALWISVVTTHMTLVDPWMIGPAMDAITTGWRMGRETPSIQYVAFETMLDEPLVDVRARFGLAPADPAAFATPTHETPIRLIAA
jgi:ubiquinone biosynthesis protein Coq4